MLSASVADPDRTIIVLRPVLAALSITILTACSTAVGAVPGVDGRAEVGGVRTERDGQDPTESASNEVGSVEEPVADVSPGTDDAGGGDDTADVVVETVAPPDPPIVAVWQEDGPETQRAQEYLLSLGFWLAEANGEYGQTTTQAVMAFQKYHGLTADGKLGPQTAEVMSSVTERPAGRSTGGTLIEVDKSSQLLFIVRDGVTEWVLNTSTGSEIPYREPDQNTPGEFIEDDSITRPGVFAVNRQREEGWWEGDLGEIYRPKYFDGGIAFHGSYNIPPYPASHGCVRLSIQAMDWIWEQDLMPMGTTVWVHGEIPERDT